MFYILGSVTWSARVGFFVVVSLTAQRGWLATSTLFVRHYFPAEAYLSVMSSSIRRTGSGVYHNFLLICLSSFPIGQAYEGFSSVGRAWLPERVPSSLMAQRAVVKPRTRVVDQFVCVCAFSCPACLNSLSETAGLAVMCGASGEVWIRCDRRVWMWLWNCVR